MLYKIDGNSVQIMPALPVCLSDFSVYYIIHYIAKICTSKFMFICRYVSLDLYRHHAFVLPDRLAKKNVPTVPGVTVICATS